VSDTISVPALDVTRLLDLLPTQVPLGVCPRALPVGPLVGSARAVPEGRWTQ
jgi:hypothetical protein